jgi:pyruvate formate lyase activating enzyme
MATFVADTLGVQTPWHLSRFFPAREMPDIPCTPISTLRRAREIGYEAGLRYVYLGNVDEGADTRCHTCGEPLIRRTAFGVTENRVGRHSNCPACDTPVAGVGMGG